MTFHRPKDPGHTIPEIGCLYTQFLKYMDPHKVIAVNNATGVVTLLGKKKRYLSLSSFSHWHKVGTGTK